jgi:16S rRNA (guanine527-N7)-methyltransferase
VFSDLLRECAAAIAPLSLEQIAALTQHYELMVKWNKVLNLTRVTDPAEAIERHYFESLFLAAHLPSGKQGIADIGSGAGFPGVPVGVLRPDCEVTLIESHQRKAVFLREATRELVNVAVVSGRAEEMEGPFDWATSRAVSYKALGEPLNKLTKQALLLTGDEAPPRNWQWDWETLRVPGREASFLRIGTKRFT